MFYYYDQSFGGVRVKNYKFLFTAKDGWLGPSLPLTRVPATYNLLWDPAEQYDTTFNGAAPTHGDLRTPSADLRRSSAVKAPPAPASFYNSTGWYVGGKWGYASTQCVPAGLSQILASSSRCLFP